MAGVWSPRHAAYAAAFYLRDHGAPGDLDRAIYAYNRDWAYVRRVLDGMAACQGAGAPGAGGPVEAAIVAAARRAIGTPYRWGGAGPGGFDCSGLAHWAYTQAGLAIGPRTTAQGQFDRLGIGRPAFALLRPGDLVFFEGTGPANPGERITHVGIYVGDPGGHPTMIDAAAEGVPVKETRLDTAYWTARYAGAGRWRR